MIPRLLFLSKPEYSYGMFFAGGKIKVENKDERQAGNETRIRPLHDVVGKGVSFDLCLRANFQGSIKGYLFGNRRVLGCFMESEGHEKMRVNL
jgi:hypothetical protein